MTRRATDTLKLVASWLLVGVPLVWGVLATLRKALVIFHGP